MGGCQDYGPFLGTLDIRCCIIIGIQKGTIILTTNHIRTTEKTRKWKVLRYNRDMPIWLLFLPLLLLLGPTPTPHPTPAASAPHTAPPTPTGTATTTTTTTTTANYNQ